MSARPQPAPGGRAVIYTRQSVAREESVSLEMQEAACREYAAKRGYQVHTTVSAHGDEVRRDVDFPALLDEMRAYWEARA